jgi:hypothetical protein
MCGSGTSPGEDGFRLDATCTGRFEPFLEQCRTRRCAGNFKKTREDASQRVPEQSLRSGPDVRVPDAQLVREEAEQLGAVGVQLWGAARGSDDAERAGTGATAGTATFDSDLRPLSDGLGHFRILLTSPLTPVPEVAVRRLSEYGSRMRCGAFEDRDSGRTAWHVLAVLVCYATTTSTTMEFAHPDLDECLKLAPTPGSGRKWHIFHGDRSVERAQVFSPPR